jgi:ABC-type microcin C transport system duplicated ATPase subunit YejF
VLVVEGLRAHAAGAARAAGTPTIRGVGFTLHAGTTLGVLGESGSGKTTLARALLGLIPFDGTIVLAGERIAGPRRSRAARRALAAVFQDPGGSLNPWRTIAASVREPLDIHEPSLAPHRREALARTMLERCGLTPDLHGRRPAALSGGQRQRAAIARALVLGPAVLLCDEPTSALDLSVQAQVLNLLADLRAGLRMAMLVITHDVNVLAHLADDVAVMRGGEVVEQGPAGRVLGDPRHEYTRILVQAAGLGPTPAPAVS